MMNWCTRVNATLNFSVFRFALLNHWRWKKMWNNLKWFGDCKLFNYSTKLRQWDFGCRRICWSVWNSTAVKEKFHIHNLPYNLIVASIPPILFFDMHLYPPKSGLCKCFMVSVICTAYIELSVSCITYLSLGIIISPIVDFVVTSAVSVCTWKFSLPLRSFACTVPW